MRHIDGRSAIGQSKSKGDCTAREANLLHGTVDLHFVGPLTGGTTLGNLDGANYEENGNESSQSADIVSGITEDGSLEASINGDGGYGAKDGKVRSTRRILHCGTDGVSGSSFTSVTKLVRDNLRAKVETFPLGFGPDLIALVLNFDSTISRGHVGLDNSDAAHAVEAGNTGNPTRDEKVMSILGETSVEIFRSFHDGVQLGTLSVSLSLIRDDDALKLERVSRTSEKLFPNVENLGESLNSDGHVRSSGKDELAFDTATRLVPWEMLRVVPRI